METRLEGRTCGAGQLIALADQTVLVVSEEGELALVSATPDQFKESRASRDRRQDQNHPRLVGDMLLVHTARMAAFRVTLVRWAARSSRSCTLHYFSVVCR
jgi:hypothetical protein